MFCCCCFLKLGLQIPVLGVTTRVRGVNVIGGDGECAEGSPVLLPWVGGAAFPPLIGGRRICTCVARSNHLPGVGTPYILNEKFLSSMLWRKIQIKPTAENVAGPPLPKQRRVGLRRSSISIYRLPCWGINSGFHLPVDILVV